MDLFTVFAILITFTAVFSFINLVYIKLPSTVGVMLASLFSSIIILISGYLGFGGVEWALRLVEAADFNHLLMNGLLSFLLFAAALSVSVNKLKKYKLSITYLATVGIIISTIFIGFSLHWLFAAFGREFPLIYAIIFGAIISPIDAVVVLRIMKQSKASQALESMIKGESLFNDAVAVVLFVFLVKVAGGDAQVTPSDILQFFVKEAFGGLLLGLLFGFIGHQMIMKIIKIGSNNHVVVILITLAIVSGGYASAEFLDVSAPLSSVVSGLFLAYSREKRLEMGITSLVSRATRDFWDVIDEVLNALLFVLIGLEVLVLNFSQTFILGCVLVIPIIIIARFISVEAPLFFLRFFRKLPSLKGFTMTWCGIRGGVSIALALSLPTSPEREIIVVLTYIVVIFSIVAQGLSLPRVIEWVNSQEKKS